jgi:hypothetical protein
MRRVGATLIPFILLGACSLGACSRLPDFAAPRGGSMDPATPQGDWIRYRALERSDFKRKEPPGQVRHGKYELGAVTCAYIKTNDDVEIDLLKVTEPNGDQRVEGKLKNLKFVAWMDRECSWWNPTNNDVPYTLEHEQIHFAISEIAARKLNQEAVRLMNELHVTDKTQDAVVAKIQGAVKELLDSHNNGAIERNADFDEDTSVGKFPEKQRQWREEVNRELEGLRDWQ